MQLTHVQKLSVTVGAAMVVLGGFAALSYYFSSRLVATDRAVERANGNMAAALQLIVARENGERSAKAYVVRPDSLSLTAVRSAQTMAEDALDVLTHGTEDNPDQARAIQALGAGVAASFDAFRSTVLVRDRAGSDSARLVLNGEVALRTADSLMTMVSRIRAEELRVLAEKTRLQSEHSVASQRVILVAMVLSFLLAGVALQPVRMHVATRITSHIVREHVSGGGLSGDADARQLKALHQLAAAMTSTGPAAHNIQALVNATEPLAPTLAAVLAEDGSGGFNVAATSNEALQRISPALGRAAAAALREGMTASADSRDERDRRWGSLEELDVCGARGAAYLVPLARTDAPGGVLVLAFAEDRSLSDDELKFAATLGRLGGSVVASRSQSLS
ncbi:MAG: CHASE3 domain-containing protein [Gemmatimonadetes bacterium]|nr:CHASE3 domain-containing protein [Gemmatimonadota bacterium]